MPATAPKAPMKPRALSIVKPGEVPPPPPEMVKVIEAYERRDDTLPPSSGVRISENVVSIEPLPEPIIEVATPASPVLPAAVSPEEGPASFQVYSLADLDKRTGGPASMVRTSLTQLHGAKGPSKWARSSEALSAVWFAFRSWVALGKARPKLADAIRAPGQVFVVEVKAALQATNWKRVATIGGMAAAVGIVLLTIVLVVADLTDDMKPTHNGAAAQAAMVQPTPEPTQTIMTPPPAPAPPLFDVVYDDTPAAKPKPKPVRPKVTIPGAKIPKGKKPGDLLIPY